jgi:hypothetical protein
MLALQQVQLGSMLSQFRYSFIAVHPIGSSPGISAACRSRLNFAGRVISAPSLLNKLIQRF